MVVAENLPDVVMLDALQLSQAIHQKQVSCREVMRGYLDHIERMNPLVNAIVVNAGEKMHQRAGVKLHHRWMPNAPTGGLFATRQTG